MKAQRISFSGRFPKMTLACALACAAGAACADPLAAYFYPCGAQAGTSVRVVVGGQGMNRVTSGWFSGTGIAITRITGVPGFPRARGKGQGQWLSKWAHELFDGKKTHHDLPPEATSEDSDWHHNPWWTAMDQCDPLELSIVGRDLFVPKNDLQSSPALADLCILDLEISPDAEPGRRDVVLFDASGASAPHAFFISKEPHFEEPLYLPPPHVPPPRRTADLPVVCDGQIFPGETDSFKLRLEKGRLVTFELTGRELLPYLGDAVPGFFNPMIRLFAPDGSEVAQADDFHYLPDPVLVYAVPTSGVYRLDVHDNLFRGRSDFVYNVICRTDRDGVAAATLRERAFLCFPQPPSHAAPEKAGPDERIFRGTIDCPGRTTEHYFEIASPVKREFNLYARRFGSPLDAVLKIYGPLGKLPLKLAPKLAEWDDETNKNWLFDGMGGSVGSVPQTECDPNGTLAFTQPGRYCAVVSDRSGFGGDEYEYVLRMGPARPSFEMYATKSAFYVPREEGSAKIRIRVVRRNGFKGTVNLEAPEGFSLSETRIPGAQKEIETELAPQSAWDGMTNVALTATARIYGKNVRVPVLPGDSVEQAFAYTHLVPATSFFLYMPPDADVQAMKAEAKNGKKGDPREPKPGHSKGKPCSACHDDQIPTRR